MELGRKNGKIYSIETNKIDAGSRRKIISARKILDSLSLDKRIEWIRHNCPNAINGFKTLNEGKAAITDTYPIDETHLK